MTIACVSSDREFILFLRLHDTISAGHWRLIERRVDYVPASEATVETPRPVFRWVIPNDRNRQNGVYQASYRVGVRAPWSVPPGSTFCGKQQFFRGWPVGPT